MLTQVYPTSVTHHFKIFSFESKKILKNLKNPPELQHKGTIYDRYLHILTQVYPTYVTHHFKIFSFGSKKILKNLLCRSPKVQFMTVTYLF
jgi:hypothetical protein